MADVIKTITITIAEAISSDVIDAYAHEFDYQEEIPNPDEEVGGTIPNPESRSQFALRKFTEQAQANIRSTYKSYMTGVGAQAAQIQADQDSLNILVS